MLVEREGDLLQADAQALVNTVNTVGVMGKGIALQFKRAFPANFKAYEAACKAREVQVGQMFVFTTASLDGPRWIINFPTKRHWRHPSRIEWIEAGLETWSKPSANSAFGRSRFRRLGWAMVVWTGTQFTN